MGSTGELERDPLLKKYKYDPNETKVTTFLVVTCIVAATGGLIFGYDLGISGGVSQMDSFLEQFFPSVYAKGQTAQQTDYCKFDSQILTLFTSSLYIAALISSLLATYVTASLGRRGSMIIGASTFFVGALLDGFAVNVIMLIFGRLLLGFGVGFVNQAVPIYLSETAPPRLRGAFNEGFQLFNGLGVLSANLINYWSQTIDKWGWRLSLGFAALPASIMLVGALILPDTPSSLVQRGKSDEARAILRRLRGSEDVEEELSDMTKACNEDKLIGRGGLKRLFTERKYLPQVTVGIAILGFQQLSGISVVAFYAPLLFKSVGFGSNASLLASVVLGVINVVSLFISMSVVDRFGRRKLLLQGCIQMIISLVMMSFIMGTTWGDEGMKYSGVVLVVFMAVYTMGYGWSWGPLSIVVPSEIFSLEVRSAGLGVGMGVQMVFTFVLAQAFLKMLCVMKYGLFSFYAGWVVIMGLFVYFFVPETKRVPMDEMSAVWREHWFWGRMVHGRQVDKSTKPLLR